MSRRGSKQSALPSAPAESGATSHGVPTLLIGGLPTARVTRAELAELMVNDCRAAALGGLALPKVVVSSNGSVIAKFHRDPEFKALMLQADLIDADGMPLVMATKLLCAQPLLERVATTDFIHNAAGAAAHHGLKFYFLGSKPGVAQTAARHFENLYPGLQIVGVRDGYFKPSDEAAICEDIRQQGADILWLGLGSPMQEAFAQRNKARLAGLGWIRTCGGLFDHYSGEFKRAPEWMQASGLEWLHRTMAEPMRLGPRYLSTNFHAAFHLATKTSDGPVPSRA